MFQVEVEIQDALLMAIKIKAEKKKDNFRP